MPYSELLIMKLSLFVPIFVRWISVQSKLLAGKYLGFPLVIVNCILLKTGVAPLVSSRPSELEVRRWILGGFSAGLLQFTRFHFAVEPAKRNTYSASEVARYVPDCTQ